MNEIRSTKGITLIALIITIIVLLILAGISVNMLFGENGVITKSQWSAFVTELTQIEEKVELKKAEIAMQHVTENINVNLFDETLEQRSDIDVSNTFKQEVMFLRENKPEDKTPKDYDVEEFDISGIYVIDKETGNGKASTYAYDSRTGVVLKIPQTRIGKMTYHSLHTGGTDSVETEGKTIKDNASVVMVDGEYYYEPDLNGFNVKETEIVYYSADYTKQTIKPVEEYISEEKPNVITEGAEDYKFHSYKNQQWANIKTKANGLEAWWVWIPRYAYKINGTSNTTEPIGVIYVGLDNKPLDPKYNGVLPEGYEVHPAFIPSGEDGSKNLKGIWASKYEPSYGVAKIEGTLAPDMKGFDTENTYIELYDKATDSFIEEVKLSDANLETINSDGRWYNYTEQQYANIKTVANGLEAWWVWIPRYAYKMGSASGGSGDNIDIIFIDEKNKPINPTYNGKLPEGYEVHPAFIPSGEDESKNLKGIWASKYEPSNKE